MTPGGSAARSVSASRIATLFTNVKVAAAAIGSAGRSTRAAGSRVNESTLSVPILLKRQDSSVRFGNGSAEYFPKAVRLRSIHHAGAAACVARWEANKSGPKLPMGDLAAVG